MEELKILQVQGLSVLMKDRFLVKNASFDMEYGECYGLIGEERSGKTSLIKAISGSLPISSGQVFFEGQNIVEKPKILDRVSVCLDPPMFFKYQTLFENISYLSMLNENNDKQKIIKTLTKFNLAHKMKTRVLFLSYYEKKLMALALAFLTEPKLLLLDEPFKGLPPESVKEIKGFIREIQAKGTSVIISSNQIGVAEDMCDKFVFMENKTIKEILTNTECKKFDTEKTYAFLEVKYPHFTGKLLIQNFDLQVKLLGKKVLFEADEDSVGDIVRYITKNKIEIYKAGYLSKKEEKIFAHLAPYFKEVHE